MDLLDVLFILCGIVIGIFIGNAIHGHPKQPFQYSVLQEKSTLLKVYSPVELIAGDKLCVTILKTKEK